MRSKAALQNASRTVAVNPARGYLEFNALIARTERHLDSSDFSAYGYDAAAVKMRLLQRIVQIALPPFMRRFAVQGSALANHDPPEIDLDGLSFQLDTGAVRLRTPLVLRCFAEFVLIWGAALASVLRFLLGAHPRPEQSVTLVYGIGAGELFAEGNDARFLEFCKRGPVLPLASASSMIVQNTYRATSTSPGEIQYARLPIVAALGHMRWNVGKFWRFFKAHVQAGLAFLRGVMSTRLNALLGRDLAYHAAAVTLNRLGLLEAVVTTNSNYSEQYLWMTHLPAKRFSFHTVWYSMGFFPRILRDDPIQATLPNYLHMRDEHSWVWTSGQAGMLRNWGARGEMHVVGPILFYMPRPAITGSREATRIGVFDVTPTEMQRMWQIGLVNNYYSPQNVRAFIEGVVEACEASRLLDRQDYEIVLKAKRTYRAAHDRSYLAYLEALTQRLPRFKTVAAETNMYSMIRGCRMVIVIPYSSPAYVSAYLNVPTIYFDPTGQLLPSHEANDWITFASGQEQLRAALDRILSATDNAVLEKS